MVHLRSAPATFALKRAFAISRGSKNNADVVRVELELHGHTGRGEGVPYARYGETVGGCIDALKIINEVDHFETQTPVKLKGAARCAFDGALWDLRAKIASLPAWRLANLAEPEPVRTAQTLSLGSADEMASAARELGDSALIKMKLGGDDDLAAVKAVRAVRPNADIIVDANEGWSVDDYNKIIPVLQEVDIKMIEQPFAEGKDEALKDLDRPIPICADESIHTAADIPNLIGLYDMVNIKLDKTGGLTEAIKLREAAIEAEIDFMIGCMVGSSLSMAPAQLLCEGAKFVDLDGPLWLSEDAEPAIEFKDGIMYPASSQLWG